jgi:hypothetical protein
MALWLGTSTAVSFILLTYLILSMNGTRKLRPGSSKRWNFPIRSIIHASCWGTNLIIYCSKASMHQPDNSNYIHLWLQTYGVAREGFAATTPSSGYATAAKAIIIVAIAIVSIWSKAFWCYCKNLHSRLGHKLFVCYWDSSDLRLHCFVMRDWPPSECEGWRVQVWVASVIILYLTL